ncbi:hypothetical protein HELRODRAFT_170845 [Helobdella robusta]|uniref:Uncharacterized protein n=1 Tax=Helobdella robusta TaxID=6412 RepID=T1F3I2_HELRO|nr:hypothetical protein HELRODRAFT_170845 [Helobdella robusta]ESO06823.1 hypothetical protein HELRODRAFT_170845 [Helobdella robusta]
MLSRLSTNSVKGKDLNVVFAKQTADDQQGQENEKKRSDLKHFCKKMKHNGQILFSEKLDELVSEKKEEYIFQTMNIMENKIAMRNRKTPFSVIDYLQHDDGDAKRKLETMREKLISKMPPRDIAADPSNNKMFVPKSKTGRKDFLNKIFGEKDYILNRLSTSSSYGKDIYASLHQVEEDEDECDFNLKKKINLNRDKFFKQFCEAPPGVPVMQNDARMSNLHMYNLEMKLKKLSTNCKSPSFRKLAEFMKHKNVNLDELSENENEDGDHRNITEKVIKCDDHDENLLEQKQAEMKDHFTSLLNPVVFVSKKKTSKMKTKKVKHKKIEKVQSCSKPSKQKMLIQKNEAKKSEITLAKNECFSEKGSKSSSGSKIQTKSYDNLIGGDKIHSSEEKLFKSKRSERKRSDKLNVRHLIASESSLNNYKMELLNKYLVTQRGEGETFITLGRPPSQAETKKFSTNQTIDLNKPSNVKHNVNNFGVISKENQTKKSHNLNERKKRKKTKIMNQLNFTTNNNSSEKPTNLSSPGFGKMNYIEGASSTDQTITSDSSRQNFKNKKSKNEIFFENYSDSTILKRKTNAIREFKTHRLSSLPELEMKTANEDIAQIGSKSSIQGNYEIEAVLHISSYDTNNFFEKKLIAEQQNYEKFDNQYVDENAKIDDSKLKAHDDFFKNTAFDLKIGPSLHNNSTKIMEKSPRNYLFKDSTTTSAESLHALDATKKKSSLNSHVLFLKLPEKEIVLDSTVCSKSVEKALTEISMTEEQRTFTFNAERDSKFDSQLNDAMPENKLFKRSSYFVASSTTSSGIDKFKNAIPVLANKINIDKLYSAKFNETAQIDLFQVAPETVNEAVLAATDSILPEAAKSNLFSSTTNMGSAERPRTHNKVGKLKAISCDVTRINSEELNVTEAASKNSSKLFSNKLSSSTFVGSEISGSDFDKTNRTSSKKTTTTTEKVASLTETEESSTDKNKIDISKKKSDKNFSSKKKKTIKPVLTKKVNKTTKTNEEVLKNFESGASINETKSSTNESTEKETSKTKRKHTEPKSKIKNEKKTLKNVLLKATNFTKSVKSSVKETREPAAKKVG